jgi:hypothetical protein
MVGFVDAILITIDAKRSSVVNSQEVEVLQVLRRKRSETETDKSFPCNIDNGSVQNSCNYSKRRKQNAFALIIPE